MKIKIIWLIGILLLLNITLVQSLEITKKIEENGRVEIIINSDESYENVKILDPFPMCLNAIEISNSGVIQRTTEGIAFIEWSTNLEPGDNYLEYVLERVYECGSMTILQPARLYIDSEIIMSNNIPLTPEQINEIKKNRCIVNGECEYPTENYLECPQDCPSGGRDGICDEVKDGICDDDCVRQKKENLDPDCLEKPKSKWIYIGIGVVVILALLIFFFARKQKQQTNLSQQSF